MTRFALSLLRILLTLAAVAAAIVVGIRLWNYATANPWTRDGRVRALTVGLAPDVSGSVVQVAVVDNQFVHKGDLLYGVDPASYRLAVAQAQAAAETQAQNLNLRRSEAARRARLTNLAISPEQQQEYAINAGMAGGQYAQATAALDVAKLNLARTEVRSPVDGWVTNLQLRVGDYAAVGKELMFVVDAESFFITGYFEETRLPAIHLNDPARIALMSGGTLIEGHVEGVSRGISDPNALADATGFASVNPIFTWVRLAQRIPVRIHVDRVPEGVHLAAGMTCTITILPSGTSTSGSDGTAGSPPADTAPETRRPSAP